MRFFSLFFGKKSMKTTSAVNYNQEVAKDFWNEVMDKYYVKSSEWGSYLFDYLDTQFKAEDHITIICEDNSDKEKRKEYD